MQRKAALAAAVVLIGFCDSLPASEPTGPFFTRNESPIVRLFGVPPAEEAFLANGASWKTRLVLDVANNSLDRSTQSESIVLDGETYALALSLRRGLAPGWEAGIDLPWVWHQGGILDGFIEPFHDTLGLPQGNRESRAGNVLDYSCSTGNQSLFLLTRPAAGPGDLRLTLARQLSARSARALAIRAGLELPTGDSNKLLGSGSTDFSLALCGSDRATLEPLRLDASVGVLAMTPGDVLPGRQESIAAFGSVTAGWNPWASVGFKLQLDWNSPLFRDPGLTPIDSWATQLVMGGTLTFSPDLSLDIGVAEDIAVGTTPDVVFHFAFRSVF